VAWFFIRNEFLNTERNHHPFMKISFSWVVTGKNDCEVVGRTICSDSAAVLQIPIAQTFPQRGSVYVTHTDHSSGSTEILRVS